MSILKSISAATHEELTRLINGIVSSKANLVVGKDISPNPAAAPDNLYKHPLSGKTLVFTSPAATVTFSADVDFKEIVDQINTQAGSVVAHLAKVTSTGGLYLVLWNDTTPVVLSDTGTANSYFGFSTTAADPDLTQTPIDPANIVAIVIEVQSRKYVCFYKT